MPDSVRPLVQAQAKLAQGLISALQKLVQGIWTGVDWYSDADVESRVIRSVEAVTSAQRDARLKTDSYLRRSYKLMGLTMPAPDPLDLIDYPRRDVTPEDVWRRPAVTYRYARSQGDSEQAAQSKSMDQVEHLAAQEITLAQRDQAARTHGRTERVTGYRRIIHPELSMSGTCGLCIVAADRIYRPSELMPIHQGCYCTVAPVTTRADPGLDLNRADLNRLYKAAGSTGRQDLSNVRIKEYVSGELGPILTSGGVEVPDGETRPKRLAKREAANAVDGKAARKASRPKTPQEQVENLRGRIEKIQATLDRLDKSGETGELAQFQREHMLKALGVLGGQLKTAEKRVAA